MVWKKMQVLIRHEVAGSTHEVKRNLLMPEMGGGGVLRRLKADPRHADLPVLNGH
jgi:hypothetical protein